MTNPKDRGRPWWLLPVGRMRPLWWVAIGGALVLLTYVAGPDTAYPVVHVIPVSLAAWYSGRLPAVALAIVISTANIVFQVVAWDRSANVAILVAETVVRGTVIIMMGLWLARLSEHEREMHRYVLKLEGLLPICAFCKSIRNEQGRWEPLESFVSARSGTQFTHGYCPNCAEIHS
jgi:hypothetical protein